MLTRNEAQAVWTLLSIYAGAPQGEKPCTMRDDFFQYVTNPSTIYEYRFMGDLGSGGKFYIEPHTWRVSCYKEDRTPERIRIEERTNAALAGARLAFRIARNSASF